MLESFQQKHLRGVGPARLVWDAYVDAALGRVLIVDMAVPAPCTTTPRLTPS